MIRQLQEPGALNDGTFIDYAAGNVRERPGRQPMGSERDRRRCRIPEPTYSGSRTVTSRQLPCAIWDSIDPSELDQRIAEIYLGAKLSVILGTGESAQAASFHPDSKQLAAYAGTYADQDENLIMKFDLRGDSLWGEWFMGAGQIGPGQFDALGEGRFSGLGLKEIDFGKDPSHRELTAKSSGMPTVTLSTRSRLSADRKRSCASSPACTPARSWMCRLI